MIRVGVGFCYYNNKPEIPRALDPIASHVYRVYCIGGRFEGYNGDSDYPTDGSTELIKERYPNAKVIEYSGYQPDSRQKYFDMAGEDGCDYLVGLDTDEFIHPQFQDWDFFYKHLEIALDYPEQRYFMKLFYDENYQKAGNIVDLGKFGLSARIYKNPGEIKHAFGSHYLLMKKGFSEIDIMKGKTDLIQASNTTIDGIRLVTDSKLRSIDTLSRRDLWAAWGFKEEQRLLRDFFVKNQKLVDEYQPRIKKQLGQPVIRISK